VPIAEQVLQYSFLAVSGDTTVDGVRALVRDAGRPVHYLVVSLPNGGFGVALLRELSESVRRLGPDGLDTPIGRLPPAAEAVAGVERTAMDTGVAQREADRQPRRRLVVLENGRPIGLLTNESRGSAVGGVPFNLFGDYMQQSSSDVRAALSARHAAERCRHCQQEFVFYELRADASAFACPHCHAVLLDA
jgi:hypothetical protein